MSDEILRGLARIEKWCKHLDDKQDKHGELLARMDERIEGICDRTEANEEACDSMLSRISKYREQTVSFVLYVALTVVLAVGGVFAYFHPPGGSGAKMVGKGQAKGP